MYADRYGFGTVKQGYQSLSEWTDDRVGHGGSALGSCSVLFRPLLMKRVIFYYMYNIIIYFIPANAFCIVMYFSSNLRSFKHTSVFSQ